MARTPMARLPWLLESLGKHPIAADIIIFGIIQGDFLFYIDNGMLCVLIRIASMRHTFILQKIDNVALLCHLTLRYG